MTQDDLRTHTLTVRDVARLANVNEDTVRRWLASGQLKGVRLSRKSGWKIRESDLDAFIERRVHSQGGL
jgi:excisionase family DNA binding protein